MHACSMPCFNVALMSLMGIEREHKGSAKKMLLREPMSTMRLPLCANPKLPERLAVPERGAAPSLCSTSAPNFKVHLASMLHSMCAHYWAEHHDAMLENGILAGLLVKSISRCTMQNKIMAKPS